MVNDALSAIAPIVAVNQLSINIAVIDYGGTIKLLATPTRNSQFVTAMLVCTISLLYRLHVDVDVQFPRPHFLPLHLLIYPTTWQLGSFLCCCILLIIDQKLVLASKNDQFIQENSWKASRKLLENPWKTPGISLKNLSGHPVTS